MQFLNANFDWGFGFDTQGQLRAGLFISLLSVWMLIGVFAYLNVYTRRRYFSIWTVAWLFYAVYLTLSYSLYWYYGSFNVEPWRATMFKQWCVSAAAVFMLWGSLRFLGKNVRQITLACFLGFLLVWSFVASYPWPEGSVFDRNERLSLQLPVFLLIGLSSLITVWGFYQYRRKRRHIGAGLLCVGFLLWGIFVAAYPLLERLTDYMSTGFFAASVLQMFIAVNMIILVLEQIRYLRERRAAHRLKDQEEEKTLLKRRVILSEERYHLLFEQSPDGIVVIEPSTGHLLEFNETAYRQLGYSREEFARMNLAELVVDERGQPRPGATEKELYGDYCDYESRHRTRNGKIQDVHVRGQRIEVVGRHVYQCIWRDITERKRAESELLRLYDQTRDDAQAKTELLREVNHRVKNNLISVLGLVMTERKRGVAADGVPWSNAALDSLAHRIQGLIEVHHMLSETQWSSIRISDLASRIIQAVVNTLAASKQIQVNVSPSPLQVSPRQANSLALALNELAMNSLKYAAAGRGMGRVSVRVQEEGDYCRLEYCDDGPGYPADVIDGNRQGVGLRLMKQLAEGAFRGGLTLSNHEGAVAVMRIKTEEPDRT